jgi:putative tricarboxylic transport membrane protein
MFDAFHNLVYGFSVAMTPQNLMYAFLGSLLGTFVGVLPGLGPLTTVAILLPITYGMQDPVAAIIMLGAITYGAMYGGSTTSILLRVPGEAASVITVIDGYEMAKQGRAGPALSIAAIGSWVAGTLSIVALTLLGPALAKWALSFGPPEYFALSLFGLLLAATLSGGKPVRGVAMALAGLVCGMIGLDRMTGVSRFTFGQVKLLDGIDIVPILMGLYGVGEILYNLERRKEENFAIGKVGSLMPSRQDWKDSWAPIGRGTVIGFVIGLLPGGGALLAAMLSYMAERRVSKHPEQFGKGAIAGVAGPESANNAAATAAFVPLLTLGIPGNIVAAVLLAALMIQKVQPGPMMMVEHPDMFWGVIASMYIGNVMLLILNLPLVGLWVKLLKLPFWLLGASVMMISAVGAYSLANDFFNVGVLAVSGVVGYVVRKANFDMGPFVMSFILADLVDVSFAQSLLMSNGSASIFFSRPISATIMAIGILYIVGQILVLRKTRAVKMLQTMPAAD